MAYSNEMSLALPPILKPPRIETRHSRRHHRPHPKPQPLDAEDLCRRLYIVIAEREARKEKRQRQQVDSMPAKWAQVERERETPFIIERLATNTTWPVSGKTAPTWQPVEPRLRSQSSSQHNKLRCRTSFSPSAEPGAETDNNNNNNNKSPSSSSTYRHIPEQAAAQFSRTTTSACMQQQEGDMPVMHRLSRPAIRLYLEGGSATDRLAVESSITPGRQRSLLQRVRIQQERQSGRNQFQDPHMTSTAGGDDDGVSRRQQQKQKQKQKQKQQQQQQQRWSSKPTGPPLVEMSMADIEGISALADLHLRTYRDHHQGDYFGGSDEANLSNADTLVDASSATATTACEHNHHHHHHHQQRVDWSQSDELLPHERKGIRLAPLLRKTGSIMALKGKLVGHLRKRSGSDSSAIAPAAAGADKDTEMETGMGTGTGMGMEMGMGTENLRIVTIMEKSDEKDVVEADDGSTPVSPGSGSTRSGRRGFWARLRGG
ncbi:hypothetical protein F4859DRAFT_515318 [Xylaria cf. heliscus]|nr:hypothetical protein F4859DRAFT_515318 [Xylaria cf. heliscus]